MDAQSAQTSPSTRQVLPSREHGLALGFLVGRYCIKMQDLHYGFWPEDLPVELLNLPAAQQRYTEMVISHIPPGVQSILDVGCGAGNTAKQLLDRGFRVDCVSPNDYLTNIAREKLNQRAIIFPCRFEELRTDRRYDLILFSESLLFMRVEEALRQALDLLHDRGFVLICDLFRRPTEEASPIGGGVYLSTFEAALADLPLSKIKELDLTDRIAPTFDLLNESYGQLVKPAYELIVGRLRAKHPWLTRFILWKFGRQIRHYEQKHFSGKRTGANFVKFKSYRLLLFQKGPVAQTGDSVLTATAPAAALTAGQD